MARASAIRMLSRISVPPMTMRMAATWFLTRVPKPSPKSPSRTAEATRPGTTAPTWSVTVDVTPPSAAFQGRPTVATATNVSSAMRIDHSATTATLAPSTRVRTGVSTSVVVMVLCRYSPVTQSTPMIGARISMAK